MNCPNCGASLPDNARFCYACGTRVGGGSSSPPPPPPPPQGVPPAPSAPVAPGGVEELHCPGCGAALKPVFGEMILTCDYCGGSVTLGSGGWKEINKHTMLTVKVATPDAALQPIRTFLDNGFLTRHAFEESTVVEKKLSFVPFWIVPVSASTKYQYQDIAVGVGGTAATIAASVALGSILGGRRGGFIPIPIIAAPPVNPTRQDVMTGAYEYPVVAVKSMAAYQPKNYSFALADRTFFDKKGIPDGSPVLNGDLGEDAAQHSARSYVTQLQAEAAHQKHHMVSQIQSQVDVAEGELLHVPVWYFLLDRKEQKAAVLVDAHAGAVMQTIA